MTIPEALHEDDAVADARARELYRYFIPADFVSSKGSSPDTILTAHAQLVAWRLNASRAMVSLIDRDEQYFVAESTKTLHLDDTTKQDKPDDAIWAGCVAVSKAGRLCEHTIAAPPPTDGGPAYFEVLNLTKDARFNKLPFVAGPPYFKYYCGVPLQTKRGTNIGSLFALDDKVREPMGAADRKFLGSMAENVLAHFENLREKEDRKRALHMNMCLAAFVDPEHSSKKPKRKSSAVKSSSTQSQSSAAILQGDQIGQHQALPTNPRRTSSQRSQASNGRSSLSSAQTTSDASNDDSDESDSRFEENDYIQTFKRAADLLYDALDLRDGGGVVFVDSSPPHKRSASQFKASDDSSNAGLTEQFSRSGRRTSVGAVTRRSTSSWGRQNVETPNFQSSPPKPVEVLAYSRGANSPPYASQPSDFVPLVGDDLARLVKRHPRGKLFNMYEDLLTTSNSSSEDYDKGTTMYTIPRGKGPAPSKAESQLLSKHFPEARQIIFLPLWDAYSGRFTFFFAYNRSDFRKFSNNPDFLYCIAFGNCVMTEITRIATIAADQQKGDFIGSISHELRSPLHGILASCEFLGETETTSFQQSLVDTADSCARTLLDTINMVLDYSKINAFERSVEKARTRSKRRAYLDPAAADTSGQLQPSLNIYGDVDLAAITEEVVEGVATGQIFKDSLTGGDITGASGAVAGIKGAETYKLDQDLEIILDISPRDSPKDWVFVTQPGAFRRIIMNLFGNALKYTRRGYIRVKLEAEESTPSKDDRNEASATIVRLTITDTGKGISPNFLRTKLFLPFSQENPLSSGTGLGLSLVRSLVGMLDGHIEISSTLGVSTEVTVTIPMQPASGNSNSGSTPSSAGSIERAKDDSLSVVQHKAHARTALLFPLTARHDLPEARLILRNAMATYLKDWFGFQLVEQVFPQPDIVITEERYLPELFGLFPDISRGKSGPMVVAVCSTASRRSEKSMLSNSRFIEAVSHPFGPQKLAKTLRVCLEKLERTSVSEDSPAEAQATAASEAEPVTGMQDVVQAVEQVTLTNPQDPEAPDVHLIRQGKLLANEESVHAPLVVDGVKDVEPMHAIETAFPFPPVEPSIVPDPRVNDGVVSPSNIDLSVRPTLQTRRTISFVTPDTTAHRPALATPTSKIGAITTTGSTTGIAPKRSPRLLLVDDNKVNLRLLQTFMQKRGYTVIHTAEDGAAAVSLYAHLISTDEPPDVIFLDISMPIMDGFEACRQIRSFEADFRAALPPLQTPPSALIIALTGLASGRDQSEAFTSGFDLYLVKPISFREVGRLLDNWEKNGGAATVGVPHGAVTGETGSS